MFFSLYLLQFYFRMEDFEKLKKENEKLKAKHREKKNVLETAKKEYVYLI